MGLKKRSDLYSMLFELVAGPQQLLLFLVLVEVVLAAVNGGIQVDQL